MEEEEAVSLMEDARQPGLLEEERLDIFIDEFVDRVRELRGRDVRVARDVVAIVGTHIRRGLTSRLPSLRRASERLQPVQQAWHAAMRHLQNVHTNANEKWAWDWWARLRVACRSASRRYKRRRLYEQVVEVDDPVDGEARDMHRLPGEDEHGMDVLAEDSDAPADSPMPLQDVDEGLAAERMPDESAELGPRQHYAEGNGPGVPQGEYVTRREGPPERIPEVSVDQGPRQQHAEGNGQGVPQGEHVTQNEGTAQLPASMGVRTGRGLELPGGHVAHGRGVGPHGAPEVSEASEEPERQEVEATFANVEVQPEGRW